MRPSAVALLAQRALRPPAPGIVFDGAFRHREVVIERVQRRVRTTRTFIGNLEFTDGNRQIVIYRDEGRFVLDPMTLALTKA